MSTRWALFERFDVPDLDRPERTYLTRWRIVKTPWFGIFVHRFKGPDTRPTLHDHPWSFVSFVLRGGYDEVTTYTLPLGRRIRRVNVKRLGDVHYITRLHRVPTWTLMFVGPNRRDWGYIDRDGTWTRFDLHPHAQEFDRAMARREAL